MTEITTDNTKALISEELAWISLGSDKKGYRIKPQEGEDA